MKTADFDYDLPLELIAQQPLEPRDASRLLCVERATSNLNHRHFYDLPEFIRSGDLLIMNDTRVIPARLYGRKESGGSVEVLLLRRLESARWEALVGGKRLRLGVRLQLENEGPWAVIEEDLGESRRVIKFETPISPLLERLGHTPLPPYIHAPLADSERYQTVFARERGSTAAPTAGLHFTPELLVRLRQAGINLGYVTLHIGLDTFKPVSAEEVEEHRIHSEWMQLTPDTARLINQTKLSGKRVVAVGTTAVRILETAALRAEGITGSLQGASRLSRPEGCPWQAVTAYEGNTDLFIYPGYRFRAVDALITNFHLPRSSLLMLVSAFAGRELIRRAYETAMAERYRFYSFGDAMLIC